MKESAKERYARLRAAGICIACAVSQSVAGKSRCSECAERATMVEMRRQKEAIKIGLCPICKTNTPRPGLRTCAKCLKVHGSRATITPADASARIRKLGQRLKKSGFNNAQILGLITKAIK